MSVVRIEMEQGGLWGKMEMGLAIVFGACCSVTDCIRQRIGAWTLWAGAAAGLCVTIHRLTEEGGNPAGVFASLVPAGMFLAMSLLTEGKIGKGDGLMLLVLGLLLGWRLCLSVLCTACLLAGILAGIGMLAGKLQRSSRLPFAPFLLAALVLTGLMERAG